ncbi:ATP-binding protein [Streptomyces pactum]|uniref:ATP-binding protein n=1 Tax=Streptomyces pactum TaxID=68249 RepID=A0ABS0NNL6_9ACTN|nr:ATP-binding protein [Streptomyces pactum]MBH5336794.1 ATP-binding protein [Streptomyces pactum]
MREVVGVGDGVKAVASAPDYAEWTFPAEPDTVRSAREVVRATLDSWGLQSVRDVTVLLVSELVTNSLRYASAPIGVRLRHHPSPGHALLVVEVSDPLEEPPREREAAPDDEGGRGLRLVADVSRRWGARRDKAGKTVWFEMALPG